jgi:hypothetical protein
MEVKKVCDASLDNNDEKDTKRMLSLYLRLLDLLTIFLPELNRLRLYISGRLTRLS